MDAHTVLELRWRAERNILTRLIPDPEQREAVLIRAALAGMSPSDYLKSGLEAAFSAECEALRLEVHAARFRSAPA